MERAVRSTPREWAARATAGAFQAAISCKLEREKVVVILVASVEFFSNIDMGFTLRRHFNEGVSWLNKYCMGRKELLN